MCAKPAAEGLRPKPGPQEEREGQHQHACSEVETGTGVDRRSALIQRSPGLIGRRPGALASHLAGFAQTAGSATTAPIAGCGMAGVSDWRKRS